MSFGALASVSLNMDFDANWPALDEHSIYAMQANSLSGFALRFTDPQLYLVQFKSSVRRKRDLQGGTT